MTVCRLTGALRQRGSLPWASALQGGDDTSSSEGSTVDCLDPEAILRKIPELADDLEEPDDCFTEGKAVATGLLTRTLIWARIPFNKLLSGHLCVQGPGLGSTGDRHKGPLAASSPSRRGRHQTPTPRSQQPSGAMSDTATSAVPSSSPAKTPH